MTAYTEADVERLATVIHDARVGGIHYGNYTLARWILDRWPAEETGRRWVFSLDSKPDVVMADGTHRYWSTHCRHGNHDLCKGTCKGCAAPCICGCGCRRNGQRTVEGSTPIASPARQCGMHYSWPSVGIVASGSLGPCVLVAAHERHRDEHGNEWRSGLPAAMVALPPAAALLTLREQLAAWRSADQDGYDPGALAEAAEVLLDGLDAAPAGEVVSVPLPARPAAIPLSQAIARAAAESPEFARAYAEAERAAPVNAPAVAAPPVDALLKLVEEYAEWRYMQGSCDGELKTIAADKMLAAANTTLKLVTLAVTRLWAAGVEEGRRLVREEWSVPVDVDDAALDKIWSEGQNHG